MAVATDDHELLSSERIGALPFDDLAALAAQVCRASASGLLLREDGDHFTTSPSQNAAWTRRLRGACELAIQADAESLVSVTESRTPATTVAVLIQTHAGARLGGLAVTFDGEHCPTAADVCALRRLARQAAALVEQARLADERIQWKARQDDMEAAFADVERRRQRLAAVIEALPDVVALADTAGAISYLNQAGRDLLGDVSGANLSSFHEDHAAASFAAAVGDAMARGTWKGDARFSRRGVDVVMAQTLVCLADPEGRPDCLVMIGRDVSDERRQQALVRQSEEWFRHLVEDVNDVLFEMDATGCWTFLNPSWQVVTGFSVGESLGRPYWDFLHPDEVEGSKERFRALLNGDGHDGAKAARYATKDGGWLWLEVRVSRGTDADGRPTGATGTLRDVTAQRAIATELSRAHEQALRSSETMSGFLANMSHEIRTPLNGVLGMSQLLLDTPLDADQRKIAAAAQQSAETLLALVNDILDISKIESGNLTLERVPFDVRQWIEASTQPGFARARTKGIETVIAVDAAVPMWVTGDPTRLRQIVTNLVDNAVKFTDAGSVTVSLGVGRSKDGRRMLRIDVRDSGIGIPADRQSVVFEKYRQSDSSTTRRYGGTGLGLAICRQLAAWMDGDVSLDSQEGLGSTFSVEVPLAAADPPEAAPATAADTPVPERFQLRVLLAEDNATNQFVATRFLQKVGCSVEVANNGAEAVTRVQEGRFDVVFMDCQMPVMDGYQATSRIRQLETVKDVPIVAMTAHAMAGDRERCLAAGMDDYVSKPIRPAELAAALGRVMKRMQMLRQETV